MSQRCAPELSREWFSERVVLAGVYQAVVAELGELEAELAAVVLTGVEVPTEAVVPEVEVPRGLREVVQPELVEAVQV